jgi:hypothetical protein
MSSAILDSPREAPAPPRRIDIDFMYLDLNTCTRCRGTDANLDTALAEVSRLLAAAGTEVAVHKTLVTSEEQARALQFISSPSIRVNGKDIALDLRESRCRDCEECACNGAVDCRVWVWQGREHEEAPTAMIVDAILREVYAGAPHAALAPVQLVDVSDNLKRFFIGKAQQDAAPASCCTPSEQATCCDPAAKASCCGAAASPGDCGCR